MSKEVSVEIELNPREQRFYDKLRSNLTFSEQGEGSGLFDLALLLPDMAVLLFRLGRDPRVPFASKCIALAATAYLLSPFDLLPELLLGPIGLIDDIVVVGAALSRMLNHVHPDVVRSHWSGQGDALDAIQRVSHWTEKQVTTRVKAVLSRLGA